MILRQTVTELCAPVQAAPVLRLFLQYLVILCGRAETASYVISGRFVGSTVSDKRVNFRDPRLGHSVELPNQAAGLGIFEGFRDNFQQVGVRDIMAGAT